MCGRHRDHKWRVIQDKAAVPSAFRLIAFETHRIFIGFVKWQKGGKFGKYMRKEKNSGTGFHMVREHKQCVEADARCALPLFSYHPLSSIPMSTETSLPRVNTLCIYYFYYLPTVPINNPGSGSTFLEAKSWLHHSLVTGL